MNYGAEPADQVVRYSLEGTEVALRLSGSAAITFAKFVARKNPCQTGISPRTPCATLKVNALHN